MTRSIKNIALALALLAGTSLVAGSASAGSDAYSPFYPDQFKGVTVSGR